MEEKRFIGLRQLTPKEKSSGKYPHCSTCGNLATQFAMFESEDVTILERYCDSCISQKKHLHA
jgi:hypothetical protein